MASKIYRMNISIPLDLKKRMDRAGQDENWSATAARAFEEKLVAIGLGSQERVDLADIKERLAALEARLR